MNLEKELEALRQENKKLKALLETALDRIKELERELGQNSQNSNWPSSRDKKRKKKSHRRNSREKSEKQSGGQKGHPGHTLEMKEKPDKVEVHRPEECEYCYQPFSPEQDVVGEQKRQVFDLPPLSLEVTEHQVVQLCCESCGGISGGTFPSDVKAPVQYGPQLKALAVYLKSEQLLPYNRTQQVLRDLFGANVSEGSLENFVNQASQRVEPVLEKVKQALIEAEVVHYDESGFYIGGRRGWLHNASTATLSYYSPHPSRGNKALEAIGLITEFEGVAVHDNWSSYWQHKQCEHALCNAHHLRELQGIAETDQQRWASHFQSYLRSVKNLVEAAQKRGETALPPPKLAQIERVYQKLIQQALQANPPPADGWPKSSRGRVKKTKARNLAERLQKRQTEVLRFAFDFRVPFDNNQAERDIRMLKVQQKISGCFRSMQGAEAFCALRSYISTIRKQAQSVWDALNSLFSDAVLFPNNLPG